MEYLLELKRNSSRMMRDRGYSHKVKILRKDGDYDSFDENELGVFNKDGTYEEDMDVLEKFEDNFGSDGELTLSAVYHRKNDKNSLACTFFINSEKNIGVGPVKESIKVVKYFRDQEMKGSKKILEHMILILSKPLTPASKAVLNKKVGTKLTSFMFNEMVPPNHVLQPKYVGELNYYSVKTIEDADKAPSMSLVTPEDVKNIVDEMDVPPSGIKLTSAAFPAMFSGDPIAKYYGLKPGQVVRFKRESLGRNYVNDYFYYRIIING